MKTRFKKSFLKELKKVKNQELKTLVSETILHTESVNSIRQIPNIKKLKGYKDFYRIRLGNYRIGIKLEDSDTVIFAAFDHRKDIYKKFP